MTVVVRRFILTKTINQGVRYRTVKPIHGGRSILVVQQQSTKSISPTVIFQVHVCDYFVWSLASFHCCHVLFVFFTVCVLSACHCDPDESIFLILYLFFLPLDQEQIPIATKCSPPPPAPFLRPTVFKKGINSVVPNWI